MYVYDMWHIIEEMGTVFHPVSCCSHRYPGSKKAVTVTTFYATNTPSQHSTDNTTKYPTNPSQLSSPYAYSPPTTTPYATSVAHPIHQADPSTLLRAYPCTCSPVIDIIIYPANTVAHSATRAHVPQTSNVATADTADIPNDNPIKYADCN